VENTKRSIDNMRRQLKEIGAMYDWDREVNSSDPSYYKWTQWMFLQLYKKDLAYKKEAPINWCPSCRTGLADEEVVEGKCERCGAPVTKRYLPQWFFKITEYKDRLIEDLADLDWPEKVKTMQANWIGRSRGAEVSFKVEGADDTIPVFTTRPDTLFGATYMVLAPEHPLVEKITSPAQKAAVAKYVDHTKTESEVERLSAEKTKTGVFTGAYAVNPVNDERIPVWIADYVLLSYGTGAIMAVPAHDERDWDFAVKFKLPIRQVIVPPDGRASLDEAYTEGGTMMSSGQYDGLSCEEFFEKICDRLEELGLGKRTVNYKLRDWLVSRQRYWGAPIPIVYCEKCGIVPVPEDQLPVLLPHVEAYQPSGTGESPLAAIEKFVSTSCPSCGGPARRDTDTISQWVCSSWYFLRYASPKNDKVAFEEDKVKYWLPVNLYIGGIEHAVLHLLYSRFFTKVLYDLGLIDFKEPFSRLFNQGMIYRFGAKMAKSKGNIVSPDDLVSKYGADSLRCYELFIGPPDQDSEWNDSGIEGVFRWLRRVWVFATSEELKEGAEISQEVLRQSHRFIKRITDDLERLHLNTVISALMEWMNFLIDQRRRVPRSVSRDTLESYIVILSAVAPHIAEEIWEILGHSESIFNSTWPTYDPRYLEEESVILVVQVNSRLKDRLKVPATATREEVEAEVRTLEKVAQALGHGKVKRVIYVPKKLINFVTE
jgi:leucyl-tRNA synthetase